MGRDEEAAELRRRAAEADKRSKEMHWHPTEGKEAADEEDRLFQEAREKQYGGTDDGESDGE